jgi:hypothetical protein
VSVCWLDGRTREVARGREFQDAIVRGLLRRAPGLDIVRVQDIHQISGEDDTIVLAWATRNNRVVLTHDLSTMVPSMHEQVRGSGCIPIVLVPDSLPTALVIEEVLLLDECSVEDDWAAGVVYLPLR